MTAATKLLSGRVIATNTLWSLAGLILPALAGLVAVPPIVRGFGDERFGVLALAWMVIGYFGLFDFGLGRAVSRLAARLLISPEGQRLGGVVWTSWYLMLLLGVVGAMAALTATPWVLETAVKVSPGLYDETRTSFYLLAAAVPIAVLTTGFRGVLEAAQRFGLVNLVRIPSGFLTFLVPLATLQFTPSLVPTILGLVTVRLVGTIAYAGMCFAAIDGIGRPRPFRRDAARELLGFGAWMTVSNVVSPMMVSFDRFFVSALISVAAVTYYATPFELVTKILFVPSAVAAVLFPAFSAAAVNDEQRLVTLFRTGLRAVFLSVVPLIFVAICFAPEIMRLWLGPVFETRSTRVMQWLALGVLVNGLGQLAFSFLQGLGRSDLTARVHLAEVPFYLLLLVPTIKWLGIEGAAIAWTLRVCVDAGVLFWLSARRASVGPQRSYGGFVLPLVLLALIAAGALASSIGQKVTVGAVFASVFVIGGWRWGLNEHHRRLALQHLSRRLSNGSVRHG